MAAAVGPRRAWSRAVLSKIRLSRRRRGLVRREIVIASRRKHHRGPARGETTRRRHGGAQELRELVPGGETMDYQNLLDETAHYVKCLTTQVKVMRSIVNYCSTPVN
ncbi:transcription factor IBH1-like [Spinacia oleracea]|uniref:Transcription factor IBH1-like n=1 Tax=Spinacia oleracea TaxID=3562 RepID=A0A9R0J133_SPIOL|nr:transcription factor IBH1-like [Spinacia oleracea]